jgi:hypothetical protein
MRHHRTFQTVFEAALAVQGDFIHHRREECSEATSRRSMIRKSMQRFSENIMLKQNTAALRKAPERETGAKTVS